MINKAYFYDNKGNKYYATIDFESDSLLAIIAYNDTEEVGSIQLIISDRIYIGKIVCNPKYSRQGIGTALIDIFEYLYKDYTGIVYGKFHPFDLSYTARVADEITRNFYNKNGYQIVSKKEYINHKELYKDLKLEDFEHTSRIYNYSLIYKENIQKDTYRFKMVDNELIEKTKVKTLE